MRTRSLPPDSHRLQACACLTSLQQMTLPSVWGANIVLTSGAPVDAPGAARMPSYASAAVGVARAEAATESEDDELAQEEADLKAAIQARRAAYHATFGGVEPFWRLLGTSRRPCRRAVMQFLGILNPT